jgi:hypothetical protein
VIATRTTDLNRTNAEYEHLTIFGKDVPSTPHNENRFDALAGENE